MQCSRRFRAGLCLTTPVCLGLFLVTLVSAVAIAQTPTGSAGQSPPPADSKSAPPAQPPTDPGTGQAQPTSPTANAQAPVPKAPDAKPPGPSTQGTGAGKPAGGGVPTQVKGKGANEFPMDPNAKWACEVTTVTHEPVWRVAAGVPFAFKIKNEGTAELKIRAQGG
ncbi:MAG TPA: hypothetical protein PKK06_14120 [Phycisphaerae bacterium]|nr:hypothetical protein [Phycisphaerae bacterium]HNU46426.1 hypothetical protein [Phycisphaerae bacterium]